MARPPTRVGTSSTERLRFQARRMNEQQKHTDSDGFRAVQTSVTAYPNLLTIRQGCSENLASFHEFQPI